MRLLIIDDEEDICDLIAEIGERRGLETRTISNTENIAPLLAEFIPDIIMMDLMMPGTDGVELLRLLSDKAKNAKLCLISGSDARVLNSARRLGSAHGLDVVAARSLGQRGTRRVVDDLRVDVRGAAEHREARTRRAAGDLVADPVAPDLTTLILVVLSTH